MKEYKIHGFMMPKGAEAQGWQQLGDGLGIRLPDDVEPYEAIQTNFKTIASHWLFTIEEIENKE